MATGTGKTTSFVERTRRCKLNGGRTLILADRDELIRQPQRKLEAIGIVADVEKARERAGLSAKVVIASVQSLRGARLTRFPRDHFDLVIADEADLAMAPSWRAIIDHFATAKLLGVTATPIRADGQALGEIFDSVAYRYEIRDAIRDGYLAPIVARRVVLDGIDLSAVKTRGGDLAQDQLAAILETERAISGVVVPLIELARDRPTVVFGVDVAHAEALAAALNDRRPGCARAVSGDTAQDERRGLLEAYERGEFQFLCNCALLCRGWDAPHTSCVAIARPTKSWALACQMAGRGTRLSPETGKRDCIADGQRVLTDVGLVPIEEVTCAMRVWDGVEFVTHEGLVCRGEQDVIEYAGLIATPDHEVWTDEGWRAFAECAAEQAAIRVTGIGREAIRESDHRGRHGDSREETSASSSQVSQLRRGDAEGVLQRHACYGWVPALLASQAGAAMVMGTGERSPAALHESQEQELPALRRSGGSVPVRESARHGHVGADESWLVSRDGYRSDRQQRPLRAGELAVPDTAPEQFEHAQAAGQHRAPSVPYCLPGYTICRCDPESVARERSVGCPNRSEVPRSVVQAKRRVWDLLNAGPRHRFTVEGLLVSNCLLLHFTGAAGKHRLIGPADCLAGSEHGPDALADDVREEIDRLLGTQQLELERVIADAMREVGKRRMQIAKDAMVRFHANEIDPFIGDDDHEGALHVTTRPEPGMFTRPPSDAQLRALDKIGVTIAKLPAAFSMADASGLLGRHAARRARGLCSLAQAKRIAQGTNIDTRAMTFERAKELCTMLRHGSWRPQALFGTTEYKSATGARPHDTKRLSAPTGVPEKATGLRQDESGDARPGYGAEIEHRANHELVDGAA